jgi:hypothetical protein
MGRSSCWPARSRFAAEDAVAPAPVMTSEAQRADVQRRGAELADYLATALGTLARFAPRRVLSSTRVPA